MKKVLKIVLNVLAWVLLVFALLITILVFTSSKNNGVSSLFGFIPMTVESPSMEPTFNVDDMIVCKEVDDINKLEKGDVITFWTIIQGKREKNTHRIVDIKENGSSRSFVTRGDNNGLDDDMPVASGDIIGKWTGMRLPGFGKVMKFLQTKTGFFCCIIIPLALFFLFELYKFIVTLIEVKKPKISEQDEEEIKRRAIEEYLASQKQASGEGEAESTAPAEVPASTDVPEETVSEENTSEDSSAENTTQEDKPE